MKKLIILLSVMIFMITNFNFDVNASIYDESDITIVFTHDLHSHIEPYNSKNKTTGGFSRIKTLIDESKSNNKNTVVLDAGDFSMGTLYHTLFTEEAIEYRLLSKMGYDAIALGNHEFDFSFEGLTDMINSAKNSTSSLSPILCSNIDIAKSGLTKNTLEDININEYVILNRNEFSIAVFSLIGKDASDVTFDENIVFEDYIESAKALVADIRSRHDPDFIVCLSHSGTGNDVNDEDVKLAKKVSDIDVIISAHTHTKLDSPIIVGDTAIVSCGEYGAYVGELKLNARGNKERVVSYTLYKVDDSVIADEDIEQSLNMYRERLSDYLSKYGFSSGGQVLARSPFDFPEQNQMSESLSEQILGNFISDSYKYYVKDIEGPDYINIDVAITPLGVIRNSIDKGDITVNDAFEILSLGVGADGSAGYPLCSVYLYGSELWQIAEIDASVSSLMSYAQLYSSGLGYSLNTNRMFLNRVYDCWLIDNEGNRIEIEKDKLYRVVSGISSAKMLGTVKDKSFGILEITPKDKDGNPITDFDKHILHDTNGNEAKEWVAFAKYLSSFENGDGISIIPERYNCKENRKVIVEKLDLSAMFINWNKLTWAVFIVSNLFFAFMVYLIYRIILKPRITKNKRKA